MSVHVTVRSMVPAYVAKAHAGIALAVQKAVTDIEAGAKTKAPVDTGNLRNSISGSMTGSTSGRVDVGADYGIYVEYGTSKMAAQPYLTPAVEEVAPSFKAAIATAVS